MNNTVTCDNCGFRYGAEHVTEGVTPIAEAAYFCPACGERDLEIRLKAAKDVLQQYLDQHAVCGADDDGGCPCTTCEEARRIIEKDLL